MNDQASGGRQDSSEISHGQGDLKRAGAQAQRLTCNQQVIRQPAGLNIVNLTQAQLHEQFYKQYQQGAGAEPLACRQQASVSLNGSALDEDHSSYWSDSTLSNCDRDSSGGQLIDGDKLCELRRDQDSDQGTPTSCERPRQQSDEQQNAAKSPVRAIAGQRRSNNGAGGLGPARVVRKRVKANERERERTKSLNEALEVLRNRLPIDETHKRSKIQTLRLAKDYIEFLRSECKPTSATLPHSRLQHPLACPSDGQQQQRFLADAPQPLVGQYLSCDCGDQKPHQPCALQPTSSFQQSSLGNSAARHQPDSPLTYKFYKFRLKKQARAD